MEILIGKWERERKMEKEDRELLVSQYAAKATGTLFSSTVS